jgi:4-carboxymuconolactone decarboxylase
MEAGMARLKEPTREQLAPDSQEAWDRIQASRGGVRGPFAVLMHVPALADRAAEVGDYLRFHGLLAGADRELAICCAAREIEARYEWQAHAPIAIKEGARPEAIEIVRARGSLDGLTPHERTIAEVVRSLYREHRLSDELYQQALAEFGREQLVELVTLAGYYGMIGYTLNAFEVDLPATAGSTF